MVTRGSDRRPYVCRRCFGLVDRTFEASTNKETYLPGLPRQIQRPQPHCGQAMDGLQRRQWCIKGFGILSALVIGARPITVSPTTADCWVEQSKRHEASRHTRERQPVFTPFELVCATVNFTFNRSFCEALDARHFTVDFCRTRFIRYGTPSSLM